MRIVQKALAYVTQRDRLLVFSHPAFPSAGIQVPAGTIREGEAPDRAVVREAIEETGWSQFGEPWLLGRADFDCSPFGKDELHDRWFFHLEIRGTPPETWRHREMDPEGHATVDGIELEFFWKRIVDAEAALIADQGQMLAALSARRRGSACV